MLSVSCETTRPRVLRTVGTFQIQPVQKCLSIAVVHVSSSFLKQTGSCRADSFDGSCHGNVTRQCAPVARPRVAVWIASAHATGLVNITVQHDSSTTVCMHMSSLTARTNSGSSASYTEFALHPLSPAHGPRTGTLRLLKTVHTIPELAAVPNPGAQRAAGAMQHA